MWRGPTWAMPNWLIMEGLTKHKYKEEAEALLERWLAATVKSGIYEQWNPLTADPYGAEGLLSSTITNRLRVRNVNSDR